MASVIQRCVTTIGWWCCCCVQVVSALNRTLTQFESHRFGFVPPSLSSIDDGLAPVYTADDLVQTYNCGDLHAAIFSDGGGDVIGRDAGASTSSTSAAATVRTTSGDDDVGRKINEYFRDELIDKRNRRMATRIDRILVEQTKTSFFFAFGAGRYRGGIFVRGALDFPRRHWFVTALVRTPLRNLPSHWLQITNPTMTSMIVLWHTQRA